VNIVAIELVLGLPPLPALVELLLPPFMLPPPSMLPPPFMLLPPPFVFPPSPLREKGAVHGSVVGQLANAGAARVALAQQPTCK